jgi:hypothetical protein
MSEARLNIGVGGMGEEQELPRDRRRIWRKKLNFDTARRLIEAKGYPEEMQDALLEKLASYPSDTYDRFLKDIGKHMNEIQSRGI